MVRASDCVLLREHNKILSKTSLTEGLGIMTDCVPRMFEIYVVDNRVPLIMKNVNYLARCYRSYRILHRWIYLVLA
jgi:hypothetical protein